MTMEVEYHGGEEKTMAVAAAEEGWQTPRREDCRIPVVPPCPAAPPRKKAFALPELGGSGKRREPPKGGYFQPPDLESLFVLAPPRSSRQAASSCA